MAKEKNNVEIEKLKVLTSEFRVSYPHVFKAVEGKDRKGKPTGKFNYSIEMLFPKKTTKLSHLQAPLKWAKVAEWGEDESDWPTPLKGPIRDGDKPYGKNKEIKPEHVGMWVVKASSSGEFAGPHVVGQDPDVKLTSEAEFYPGCWARAQLKAHAFDFGEGSAGTKFILDGVQKVRDGQSLGGRKAANEMFGVVEGDDGEEELDDSEESFM